MPESLVIRRVASNNVLTLPAAPIAAAQTGATTPVPPDEPRAPALDFSALSAPDSAEASRGLNPRMIGD